MADFSKADIKEVVVSVLEPFAKSIQGDLTILKSDVSTLKSDVAGVNARLISVENDVKWMKTNSGELFTKLDELITLYRDEKQERVVLAGHVKRLEERVAKLEAHLRN